MEKIKLLKPFAHNEPNEPLPRRYEPGEYEVAEDPTPAQISPRGAEVAVKELRIAEEIKVKASPKNKSKAANKPAAEGSGSGDAGAGGAESA